ncbi:MAG: copper homeostasis protein CutC [Taibaiella sp.]|nr:copper homeostasis protein CutC [Taibaiella sp.]
MIIEVCAFNIQSCMLAYNAGASRIELCADPMQGGVTPSYGTIRYVREKVPIPLFPIIRPRGGSFVYDDEEFAIMRQDILLCKELGCDGIATGMQLADGRIDADRLKQVVEWAYPMQVTVHRVFDVTPDPFAALETIIDCGCARILTSGQQKNAMAGAYMIAKLGATAGERIAIMPGGGVRSANIKELIEATNANEFHTSALISKNISGDKTILSLGDTFIADANELQSIMAATTKFEH